MLEALVISNVVLWAMVIVLAAVVVALVRQVGVLHERVSPAGALVNAEGPTIGHPAPHFDLTDWAGSRLTLGGADARGRDTLLVFVSPSCPVCATLLPIADAVVRTQRDRVRVVFGSDGPRQEHEAFVRAHRLADRAYVLSTELGLAYHVSKLPYAALIDGEGILRAKGLVNTREHLESLFEARARGIASVQEYLRGEAELPHVVAALAGEGKR